MSPLKIHRFVCIWSKTRLTKEREALVETVEGEKEISLAVISNSEGFIRVLRSVTVLQVWALHMVERDKAVCI